RPQSPPVWMGGPIVQVEAVQLAGVAPLSVGTTWTQVHLLEAVLMSELGADASIGLWDGSTDWEGAEVTSALETFETLMAFTNTDRDGLDWPEATQMVIDGSAAYNVMGDWAVAEIGRASCRERVEVRVGAVCVRKRKARGP